MKRSDTIPTMCRPYDRAERLSDAVVHLAGLALAVVIFLVGTLC